MWNRAFISILCCLPLFGDTRFAETSYGKNAYISANHGSKTVVFQAGLGDDKSTWEKLLKKSNGSFSYIALDRLGKGDSSEPIAKRSPCDIAREQREALQKAGVKPPFVLVGHSIGGLYQYVYAKMYPADVSALVLLDPTHPKHWENLQNSSKSLSYTVKALRLIAFSGEDKKEFDAQAECLNGVDMDTPLITPTTFLFSGNFSSIEKGTYEEMLYKLRRDWRRLLPLSTEKTIYGSGHYLQKEAIDETTAAISASITDGFFSVTVKHELINPNIRIGESSKQEIEAILGKPSFISKNDTEIWVYHNKLDVPLAVSLIPIIGDIADIAGFVTNSVKKATYTAVFFDKNGVVEGYETRESE